MGCPCQKARAKDKEKEATLDGVAASKGAVAGEEAGLETAGPAAGAGEATAAEVHMSLENVQELDRCTGNGSLSTADNDVATFCCNSEASTVSSLCSVNKFCMLCAAHQRLTYAERGIEGVNLKRAEQECSALSQQIISKKAEVEVANRENDFVELAGISQALIVLQDKKSGAEVRLKEAQASIYIPYHRKIFL